MTHPTPIAVHRADGLVLFDDDTVAPVSLWIDGAGDPCDAADAAACVVEGPTCWWAVDLREFREITAH